MRRIYERVLADREARGQSSDVPVEDILAVVERRGSEEQRSATLNRLLATAEGRRELDLVRAAVQSSRAPRASRFRIPLAIAATLAIALLGRTLLQNEPDDAMRGDENASAISLLSPPEELAPTGADRFTWTRVAAATSYQPELIDDTGLVVWTQTTTDTSIALPGSITLTPGKTYRWRVVARTETGEVLSASRPLRILPR
jgi:hypothetical protein